MISWAIQVMNVNQNAKKGPPCHQKIKCWVLDYVQLLMISWVIWAMKVDWNVKKGPLCHQKIKCSFLDYVQLLMIGRAIRAKNSWLKCKKNQKKGPLSHQKIKCSFLDYDQPSNPSKKRQLKCKKNKKGPLSHWKIKCSFLDYIQLLMIGRAIRAKNVDRNAKKQKRPLKSLKNKMFIFGLHSTSDDWPSHLSDEWWLKCKKRPPKS